MQFYQTLENLYLFCQFSDSATVRLITDIRRYAWDRKLAGGKREMAYECVSFTRGAWDLACLAWPAVAATPAGAETGACGQSGSPGLASFYPFGLDQAGF